MYTVINEYGEIVLTTDSHAVAWIYWCRHPGTALIG